MIIAKDKANNKNKSEKNIDLSDITQRKRTRIQIQNIITFYHWYSFQYNV